MIDYPFRQIVQVLGAGGHGQDVASIAEAAGHIVEFYDDNIAGRQPISARIPGRNFVVGVNDPATRRRLAVGSNAVTLVHPTATVDPTAVLEPGCVIGAGTHIGPGCFFGPHVHVGPGCTITRTVIGGFTTVSPGVDIAGDVAVGYEVLIGVGATVANLRRVGAGAVIGAGAVVVRDVESGETVACKDLAATREGTR